MLRFLLFILSVSGQALIAAAQADPSLFVLVQPEGRALDKLLSRADSLSGAGAYDLSLRTYESARQESSRISSKTGVIKAGLGISSIYKQTGDFAKANDVLGQTLQYCSKKDSTARYIAYIHNLQAVNYCYWGMYEKSAQSYEKAILAAEAYPSDILVEDIILNMATFLCDINMPRKALGYLTRLDTASSVRTNTRLSIRTRFTKAYAYRQLGDARKSRRYLLSIVPVIDSIDMDRIEDFSLLFTVYWRLAELALNDNSLGEAQHYLDRMRNVENTRNIESRLHGRINRIAARIYMRQGQYDKAAQQYRELLQAAQYISSLPEIITAHEGMAQAYAAQGRYQQAYEQEQVIKLYKDSLNRGEQVKNAAVIEARYQNARKEKDLAEKELRISRQDNAIKIRNIMVAVTGITALLLLVLFLIIRKNFRHRQALKDEKLQLLIKERELDEMKAVMEGEEQERTRIARDIHDGLMIQFSTVKMNLSALLGKEEGTLPYLQQLDKAIASLRSTAHNLMPDVLLDGGLAEAIYYFCENIREHVTFEITFNLLNDVPRFEEKFELSVYRIVQELVQNIIKHAAAQEAYIQIGYREGLLNITIEDDGVGMPGAAQEGNAGLGLKSIKNRMPALNGTMEISGEPDGGTSIILEFTATPLQV